MLEIESVLMYRIASSYRWKLWAWETEVYREISLFIFLLCSISQYLIYFLIVILLITYLLQLKDLRISQWEEPCIGLTQENSIESSVQYCLPYIPISNGLCKLFLTYPKRPCVCLKVNMCFTCYMISSFQNLLHPSMCHVTCDHVIWCDLLCDSVILSL